MIGKTICVALWVGSIGACGSDSTNLSDTERTQLLECSKGLDAMAAEATAQPLWFVKSCGQALGFDKIINANPAEKQRLIAKETDILCNSNAGKAVGNAAPTALMQTLVESCSAEYYGLKDSQKDYLSFEWFLVQRTGAWLSKTLSKADKTKDSEVIKSLNSSMSQFRALLPVAPSTHGIGLWDSEFVGEMHNSYYVVIDNDSAVAYTRPYATLSEKGSAIFHNGSGSAQKTALATLKKNIAVTRAGRDTGVAGASGRKVSAAKNAPLLIAKHDVSAQSVLAIADRLFDVGAHLGAGEGLGTQLTFGVVEGTTAAVDNLRAFVGLNDDYIALWIGKEMVSLPNTDSGYDWRSLKDHFSKSDSAKGVLLIAAGPKATYEDLVRLFDVASGAEFAVVTTGIDQKTFSQSLKSGEPGGVPKVEVGDVQAVGALDPAILRRYMERVQLRFRFCYEVELAKTPGLGGSVQLEFVISPFGSVQGAKVTGDLNDKVHSCIASTAKRIKFPKPRGGGMVTVKYPILFAPM